MRTFDDTGTAPQFLPFHPDLILSVAGNSVLGVSMNVIAYIGKTFSNAASGKRAENNIDLHYQ
jgi:hypothetical protein